MFTSISILYWLEYFHVLHIKTVCFMTYESLMRPLLIVEYVEAWPILEGHRSPNSNQPASHVCIVYIAN